MFAGIPDLRVEATRSVRDGDIVWTEWRWTGTRTDGEPFEVRGVTLFEVRDDRISAGTLYLEDVERQAGDIEDAVQALSGQRPKPAGG
jgi:ketosteroid isomerase-like protein